MSVSVVFSTGSSGGQCEDAEMKSNAPDAE